MNIPQVNLPNILGAISAVNHVLNEQVKFVKHSEVDCPDCGYDPVRKESTNYDCDTCNGKGSIVTELVSDISASVETEQDSDHEFTKAGRITKGQILLTVDIKEIKEVLNLAAVYDLNEYPQLKKFIDEYKYIIWKGAKYVVDSFEAGWLQGNLYEISFTLSIVD